MTRATVPTGNGRLSLGAMASTGSGVPPHNLEAEQSVLGAVLLSDRAMYRLVMDDGLRPEDFYRERHRAIYRAMLELYNTNEPVDAITVTERLRHGGVLDALGGPGAVQLLVGAAEVPGNVRHYAAIVRELAALRRLQLAAYDMLTDVAERGREAREIVARAEHAIFSLGAEQRPVQARAAADVLSNRLDALQRLHEQGGEVLGRRTGFGGLDDMIGGTRPGQLIVLAARPSMGKTTMAQNIAAHQALHQDAGVLFASLEMSEEDLADRHFAAEASISGERIARGPLDHTQWRKLIDTAARAQDARLWWMDSGSPSVFDLRSIARETAARRGGIDLLVVDYLQLMRADPPSGNRTEDVSGFSRGLKQLARELECTVLALAQLSRKVEERNDKRPLLGDLRESGQIEADADVVMMLYRDDYYHPEDSERAGVTDVLVRKCRQGATGDLEVTFDAPRFAFRNSEPERTVA